MCGESVGVYMSSHSDQTTGTEAWTLSCTFCACRLTEEHLALQSYASNGATRPEGLPDHGGLTLCPGCAGEVAALLDSWEPHRAPPVADEPSIGDAYGALATDCSFCTDEATGTVLGVELYRRVDDGLPAYANYTLCGDCRSVFDEFLGNVRRAAES